MFKIRNTQQDHLAMSVVGTALAKGLGGVAKSAYFSADTAQVCVVGARDQRSYLSLDAKGRIVKTTTPLGRKTEFFFSDDGLTRTVHPTGLATDFEYREAKKIRRFTRSDGATTSMQFDEAGNLTELTGADGGKLEMRYDEKGRLSTLVDRDGAEVHRTYDGRGRLTRIVDPLGRTTRLDYGAWTAPDRITYPDGTVEEYRYGRDGAAQRINGKAHAEYETDDKGRLAGAKYQDGQSFSFEYDDQGRVKTATSDDAVVECRYDDRGRITAEAQDGRVVRYAYDEDGQLASLTLPSGEVVTYAYDADGRLSAVRDWRGQTQRCQYGQGELPRRRELPNGLTESTEVDLAGNVTAIEVGSAQGTLFYQRYGRNVVDRVVTKDDSRHGARHYVYSASGQLIAVTKGATGEFSEHYAYDAASCRTRSHRGAVSHDSMNRPVADGPLTYSYDALGNRTERTDEHGTTRYTYGRANLITRVDLPDGRVIKYGYDAFSRRVRKETSDSVTVYIWAGHQLVQELIEEDGEEYTREYLYAPGRHTPLALRDRGNVFFYHTDSLGTPQLLTDGFGSVAWSAQYDSFGTATVELERVSQPLRFAGQYHDAETGLHYNRARYYDPHLGTYLSRDPDAPVGGVNHYVYAGSDPVNGTDPLGLFLDSMPSWAKTAVSVAGGVAAGLAVGLAVGAAVVALAPAIAAVTVAGVGLAVIAGIVAGGVAGGAMGAGLGAGMNGGCIPCAIARGAALGLVGAIPFLAAEAIGAASALAIGVYAAAGAVSGAITYSADVATSSRPWDWGDFGVAVGTGAALGGLGKWIGGKIGASEGKTTTTGSDTSTGGGDAQPKGDAPPDETSVPADERPTKPPPPSDEEEPPPIPPDEVPPPKTDGKYADDTVEMTDRGKRVDSSYPVEIYDEPQLEAHRVVASKDGRMIYAQSGEPVNCTAGPDGGIYVMDKDGNVYVQDKSKFGQIHHSTLAGGEEPVGGGQLTVQNGKVVSMDESTGHYGSNMEPGTAQTIADELASQGVDMSNTNVQSHPK